MVDDADRKPLKLAVPDSALDQEWLRNGLSSNDMIQAMSGTPLIQSTSDQPPVAGPLPQGTISAAQRS